MGKSTNMITFMTLICTIAMAVGAHSGRAVCENDVGDKFTGGACYVTTQTLRKPFDKDLLAEFSDDEQIKEWHFHVYFYQHNKHSYAAAMRIRQELLNEVRKKKFVAVFSGVTDKDIPG